MATGIFKKAIKFLHDVVQEILFVDAMADAAQEGNLKKINLLVRLGADINHAAKESVVENDEASFGRARLTILSAGEGYAHVTRIQVPTFVHMVRKGMNPDQASRSGQSFLTEKLSVMTYEELKDVIAAGADVNFKNGYRKEPVSFSIAKLRDDEGGHKRIRLLIDAGMDINAADSTGETLAHKICRHPLAISLTFFLIENGLDMDAVNAAGETPLDTAVTAMRKYEVIHDGDFIDRLEQHLQDKLKIKFDQAVKSAIAGVTADILNTDAPVISDQRIKMRI